MDTKTVYFSLRVLLLGLALIALSAGCLEPLPPADPPTSPTSPQPTGWYSVYFTEPDAPGANSYRGGPDEALAAAIDQARLSVDVAAFDLDLWSIRDALIQAHRRGLTVRMVVDSDNLEEAEIQELKKTGIDILGDRREGLMHNKFVVIDRLEVWTGSMNFSVNDAYRNNNNLIRISSSRLAEDYTTEFNEMYEDDLFGPDVRAATPYPKVTVDGTTLEVYFSPDDGVATHLLNLIQKAKQSIEFMAYSFTSDELAKAILERARAGVSVSGVMEESQNNLGTEYDRFRAAGLKVYLDGNPHNMHHKALIIDKKIVVTGSYNFSANAEKRNDENSLVIYNTEIAAQYFAEFERVLAEAKR